MKWTVRRGILFTPYPAGMQIVYGVIAGFLNYWTASFFTQTLKIPLFFDCIWTISASFLGLWSGLICAGVYHVCWCTVQLIQYGTIYYDFLFSICSVTLVLIVRSFCLTRFRFFDLLVLEMLSVLSISIEGGIIASLLYNSEHFIFSHPVDMSFRDVIMNNATILLSAIISRLVVNMIDKCIAVAVGFFLALSVKRLLPPDMHRGTA